jgi:tRNA threonylcarbamoyladenosine biosynthesis protein TsaE
MPPRPSLDLISNSAERTREIGAWLGRRAAIGDLILLHGDLGSGKTTLTQGIAHGLGIADVVQSPTFTLVNEHEGVTANGEPIRLYHIDLYRLGGADELASFGFADYLVPVDGVTVVEWPERANSLLPDAFLLIRLEALGEGQRLLVMEPIPADGLYAGWLPDLREALVP